MSFHSLSGGCIGSLKLLLTPHMKRSGHDWLVLEASCPAHGPSPARQKSRHSICVHNEVDTDWETDQINPTKKQDERD
jgi:hypothetical protein